MSESFIGEIRMFGGTFAPNGWAFCDGRTLAIAQNDALFALLGTTYGGDGVQTFNLPDLRGRLPVHQGNNGAATYVLGQLAGSENVTLSTNQLPAHNHALQAGTSPGTQASPSGNALTASSSLGLYTTEAPDIAMAPTTVGASGGSQPHNNLQPFLCVNFIISLFGIFPSRN
ncbi:MAG TPA: tail fiber protein [Solirubrobacteraceae bacterium]|nr:tail fiber protein [Solirubrobacteraceae bacterium]